MKVLLTGFEPFGGESINPSWEAVKKVEVEGVELVKRKLPVSFKRVRGELPAIILEERPDVVILTGLAGGRPNITVERVAINVMDARMDDNDGYKPEDEPVVEGGPDAYFSTLPIKAIIKAHRNAGIPSAVSNTAGTYVCNTAMYVALHTVKTHGLDTIAGFIHVPYIPEQVLEKGAPSMPLDMIVKAIEIAVRVSVEHKLYRPER
ncbi:pyroglutamyl-peptidase I [Pyrococcus yayanosii]|uniref:Pyrrolidone-carboxylate peptidase n=1 Tax=Pyrococcus yayanosii (strain CH1 / JCM 16557) TaxID=529709 RepID=F8AID9_PYRYC|nr:pyroglutamyl-peptidase I [Pyrococcus yayanosii]AEH25542.1 pyrrolidone-carboxylate peptidase [Pyrococcus yayanosii CH1]